MAYPIVEVTTKDKIILSGLLSQPVKFKTLYLNIHGTGSSFFCEVFQSVFYDQLPKLGIDVLFTNNRGSCVLDDWQDIGAALEMFEDSLLDIDAWMEWALKQNYHKIILSGHSFGTEKAVYYMNYGKHKDKVSGLVLMGFCDSVGSQQKFEKTIKEDLVAEARQKLKAGKGYELLTGQRKAQAGETAISAETYINLFSKNSELSKVIPLRKNSTLPMIRKINVPTLATVGDHDEYTIIPIKKAMALLEKENERIEIHQLKGSNHCYEGYQQELIKIVKKFLLKNSLV